jgi:choline-sulfatase
VSSLQSARLKPCSPIALLVALQLTSCGGSGDGPGAAIDLQSWPVAVQQESEPAFERVVLVTIDTLRADHVSAYGYGRKTTPFLDSLAERGVLFENALAAISHTAPSHATMLTGLVPTAHGIVLNGGTLDPAALDLARLSKESGYATGAFVNVQFLAGIAGSFDEVGVRAIGKVDGRKTILTGEHVVDAAIDWLNRRRSSERFFLWVHLYDPHKWKELMLEVPDGPLWTGPTPDDFMASVARLHGIPEPRPGEFQFDWKAAMKSGRSIDTEGAESFQRSIDAYDALTAFSDRQVKRLYGAVEGLGLPGRTLWVVTSDHGEGLASHGVAGHGGRIYQEQLRVPLVLHASDGSIAPARRTELVAHIDLFATVAEALGRSTVGVEGLYEGRSLWPLLRGEQPPWGPRSVFAQRKADEDPPPGEETRMYALQDENHKYLLHEPGEDEFYDLTSDPLELDNRIGRGDPAEAALQAELLERLRLLEMLSRSNSDLEVPEEWMEELRDLGYAR